MKKMYLFALLALTMLSYGQDLILDGGFESQTSLGAATTPWYSANGGITFVTTNFNSGSRALQWGTTYRTLNQAITATPGTTYIGTFYVRSNQTSATGDNTVYVGITDGSNNTLVPPIVGLNAPFVSSANGYVKYTFTFTAPQANLTLAMSKGGGNATINLDDISIVPGALSTLSSTGPYSAAFSGSTQSPTFTANPPATITHSYRGITYNSTTAPSAVGNYSAIASVANGLGRDYLTVPLTITGTPTVSVTSTLIASGQTLGSTTLTVVAPVAGTFALNEPLSTVPPAGQTSYVGIFTPSDTANFSSTTASVIVRSSIALAGWNVSTIIGGTNFFGTSPLNATVSATGVTVVGLTRGSGITTTGFGATRAWGGHCPTVAAGATAADSNANAVNANSFITFTVKPTAATSTMSIYSINPFGYRRPTTNGAAGGAIQYSINNGAFVTVANLSFPVIAGAGGQIAATNLTGVAALQNIPSTSTVTFRILLHTSTFSQSAPVSTFYIFDFDNSVASDLTVNGFSCVAPTAPTVSSSTVAFDNTAKSVVATVDAGATVDWYSTPTGGSAILSNSLTSPTNTNLGTYTFYAEARNLGCSLVSTTRTMVQLIIATNWNGAEWVGGIPTINTDAIISSAYATTTNGAITAKSLTINNNQTLTVNDGATVTVAAALVNNGSIVIENNANLIQTATTNTNSGTGTTIVNRKGSTLKRLDFTLWSSPVAGTTLKGFSPLTVDPRFYQYLESSDLYSAVSPTTPFAAGKGYLIRMPDLLPSNPVNSNNYYSGIGDGNTLAYAGVFTGTLNNGDIPVTLEYTKAGYQAVGNPYPSVIDAQAFVTANSTKIENTLYFWRKANRATTSAYATWTAGGGTAPTPTVTSEVPNGKIQVGQGFFVKAKSDAAGTVTNFFNNSMRDVAPTSTQFFKVKQQAQKDRLWLNLTGADEAFSQTLVAYIADADLGLDKYDGKYINDSEIALTSNIAGDEYTIQGRPAFDATDVVALNFKTNIAGSYNIAIDHVDGLFSNGQAIYLTDKTTGVTTNLNEGAYSFTAAAGVDNTRFTVTYQKTLKIDAPLFNENSVLVSISNGTLNVKSSTTGINNVKVFDIQGRLVAERKNVTSNTASIANLKANQVLIVKVTGADNSVVTKKVLN